MTEIRENNQDDKRKDDADKERIGLLRHISTVSLAAMIFIGGWIDEKAASLTLKCATFCFLLAVASSLFALILTTANVSIPRGSPRRFFGNEYIVNRIAVIFAVFFSFAGCVFLAVQILFS